MTDAAIDITSSAAERVATIATKQGKPAILRLSVEGGGCAGFQYKFGLADMESRARMKSPSAMACGSSSIRSASIWCAAARSIS
jgi:Fe-S cluster assembly iron-binding protein IscA